MILHYFNRLRQAQIPTGGSAPSFTFVSESATDTNNGFFGSYTLDLEIGISTLSGADDSTAADLTGSDEIRVYVDYGGGTPTTGDREVAQTSIIFKGTNWEIDDQEGWFLNDPYSGSTQATYLIVATNSVGTTQATRTISY